MDPRGRRQSRPARHSGEARQGSQDLPYVESTIRVTPGAAQVVQIDAEQFGASQRLPAPALSRQRPAYLPSEDDMAGLDVFGASPPAEERSAPGELRRDSGYRPATSLAESAGALAPRSGPLPITLGPTTGAQPAAEASAAVAVASRPQTLTGQLRSVAPPDVARQAIQELGVLAGELEALPDQLVKSGLARQHRHRYRSATLAYVGLAERAWEAVAEERLEQAGAEDDYRAQAIEVARQITHMQNDVRMATEHPGFRFAIRRPLLWRRRVRLARAGLGAWMSTVSMPPDPRAMGQGLFQLRGYVGLANASLFELTFFGALLAGVNDAGVALALGLVLLQIPTLLAADASLAVTLAFGAVLVAVVWLLALLLTVAGRAPLRLQLGATFFTPMHTIRNTHRGSPLLSGLLRGWSALVMLAGVASAADALVQAAVWVRDYVTASPPTDLIQLSKVVGTALVVLAAPVGILCLAAVLLIALPLLLVDQARLTAELSGNSSWVPRARRSVLRPALGILGFLTGALLIAVYAGATALGLADRTHALLLVVGPSFEGMVTWRAVLLLVAVVLPYVLLVDLPFRRGTRHWQQRWLQSLTTRRAELESHMRRLSTPDPRSGSQDSSEENLRAMQYDMVLLQFYRSKVEETERTPTAPFTLRRVLTLLALGILLAIVVDNAGSFLTLLLHNADALTHLLGQ